MFLFVSPAVPRRSKTKAASEVRSDESSEVTTESGEALTLSLDLTLSPTTEELMDQEEDLEAETSPDLIEGDIAISQVILAKFSRFVFTLNSDCQDLDPRLRLAVDFARYPTKKWPNNTVRYRISTNYS